VIYGPDYDKQGVLRRMGCMRMRTRPRKLSATEEYYALWRTIDGHEHAKLCKTEQDLGFVGASYFQRQKEG